MGLRKLFKTDKRHETEGVVLDYGETRIRVARAGGANKPYLKALDRATKPFRRAIATGAFSDERATGILREVYAKTIVLNWETKRGGEWLVGIDPEDLGVEGAELQPVTQENVVKVFENLPDLFTDVRQQAESMALFRTELDEAAAGN